LRYEYEREDASAKAVPHARHHATKLYESSLIGDLNRQIFADIPEIAVE
jgi:hypothetical protein